jgi:RNA polymerase-binding protein DksA
VDGVAKSVSKKSKPVEKLVAKPAPKVVAKTAAPVAKVVIAKPAAKPGAKEVVATAKNLPAKNLPSKNLPSKNPSAAPVLVSAAPHRKSGSDEFKPGSSMKNVVHARVKRVAPANGRPAPLASVPTNGKPRKNQAGMNARELETYRALLLEKRHELVGDVVSMERESLRASSGSNLSNLPLHMADQGTDNYEQEFTLGIMEKDRKLLKEINHALAKIQDGSYGICEGTNQPISKARLEAQPWARYSIDYARQLEHGGVGRISAD